MQGTVGSNSRDYVRIVNERNTYGTIKVTKTVAGNAGDPAKQFNFNIAFRNQDGSPLANATLGQGLVTDSNGELTFSLSQNDGAKVIKGIPNGAAYEVSEDPDGYVATVPANAAGTIAGGSDPVEVAFANTLDTYADVTVRKVLAGNDASSGATKAFQIALPGTYAYEMSEVPGTLPYDYDTSTYTVTYEVVAEGTQLRATRTIARDATNPGPRHAGDWCVGSAAPAPARMPTLI